MCRWIAYRGEPTALERYVTSPTHSLVEQSMRALESTAATNGDGSGLAGTPIFPIPASIARSGRRGPMTTCVTSAAISGRICSSLMWGPPPAPP